MGERIKAVTGVGGAIAAGNQEENEISAFPVMAAKTTSTLIQTTYFLIIQNMKGPW